MNIPRWTDNPNFNAQAAHFGVGYGVAMTTMKFAYRKHPVIGIGVSLLFIAYAALKEFWYDANFEIPAQDFASNFEDFFFYHLGFITGLVVGSIQ